MQNSTNNGVKKVGLNNRVVKNLLDSSNASFINVSQSLCQGDRYIPRRDDDRFEYGNHTLVNRPRKKKDALGMEASNIESLSPPNVLDENDENRVLKNYIRGKADHELDETEKIWVYKGISAPQAPVGYMSRQKVLFTGALNPSSSVKKAVKQRVYPASEIRILDAPNLLDDYYTTPVHWGRNNHVAVALTDAVYVYVPMSGDSYELFAINEGPDYISSLQYSNSAQYLSVALSDGNIHLLDIESKRKIRTMRSQVNRIACQTWNHNTLSFGTRSGCVYHSDVRVKDHKISMFQGHSEEVCAIEWSADKKYLVSAGGDCKINVMCESSALEENPRNMKELLGHTGSIKSLAFTQNPYYIDCMASGGGTNDGTIKLWNLESGALTKEVETHSPVNGIYINDEYKEIMTFHGNPSNGIRTWGFESLKNLHSFQPYAERIISHSVSPGHEYVVTASADQVVKIWHMFPPKDVRKQNKPEFEFVETSRKHVVTHRIR